MKLKSPNQPKGRLPNRKNTYVKSRFTCSRENYLGKMKKNAQKVCLSVTIVENAPENARRYNFLYGLYLILSIFGIDSGCCLQRDSTLLTKQIIIKKIIFFISIFISILKFVVFCSSNHLMAFCVNESFFVFFVQSECDNQQCTILMDGSILVIYLRFLM